MSLRLGRNVLIKVDANGVGGSGASWTAIGQQVDGGWDMKAEKVDGTVKGDLGWTNEIVISRSWTVTAEGKCDPADSIYQKIWTAWKDGTTVYIQVDRSQIGGTKYEALAYVELSEKYPQKDLVTFSVTFSCQGAPTASAV